MSEHTPGPWQKRAPPQQHVICRYFSFMHNDRTLVQSQSIAHCVQNGPETVPNADLIAAAPDLYAALTECRTVLKTILDDLEISRQKAVDVNDTTIAQATAIIADSLSHLGLTQEIVTRADQALTKADGKEMAL